MTVMYPTHVSFLIKTWNYVTGQVYGSIVIVSIIWFKRLLSFFIVDVRNKT